MILASCKICKVKNVVHQQHGTHSTTQIAKTIILTSIRHRPNTQVSNVKRRVQLMMKIPWYINISISVIWDQLSPDMDMYSFTWFDWHLSGGMSCTLFCVTVFHQMWWIYGWVFHYVVLDNQFLLISCVTYSCAYVICRIMQYVGLCNRDCKSEGTFCDTV